MKFASPAFGLISGLATAFGFLPHLITLIVVLISGMDPRGATPLILFTIGARLLGEWLFWRKFLPDRLDSEGRFRNWRSVVNQSLLSHPNVSVALIVMLGDICLDATLVYLALQTSISPIWVFLSLLGCQALSSPIQGALSDCFSQKKSLIFALIMGMVAGVAVGELPLDGKIHAPSMYSVHSLLGLASFTLPVQMFIILCGKGLLANLTVIARAAIAQVIKVETIENPRKA